MLSSNFLNHVFFDQVYQFLSSMYAQLSVEAINVAFDCMAGQKELLFNVTRSPPSHQQHHDLFLPWRDMVLFGHLVTGVFPSARFIDGLDYHELLVLINTLGVYDT